jgi:MerR family transcriptional regulator, light-induced transcriptional regulator
MEPRGEGPLLRIGELSRRLGISDHVLRAWESRYGLLQPVRSAGGFRLYSAADEARVRRMQAYLAEGLSAAQAARAVLREDGAATPGRADPGLAALDSAAPGTAAPSSAASGPAAPGPAAPGPAGPPALPDPTQSTVAQLSAALREAFDAYDELAAQAVIDRLVSDLSVIALLRDVVLPYLAELGDRWERGTVSIAQEHFASNIIRGRLAGLARGWGGGHRPRAVLACPPGEQHDLALMIFGIVLNRSGWSIDFFGTGTPVEELDRAVDATHPDLIVLAATVPDILEPLRGQLAGLASRAPLALAGAGATSQLATAVGARLMGGDLITEAEQAGRAR